MRLSKKQQAIIEIVRTQQLIEKQKLFEELEGIIEDKKTYRSKYNSFSQTLKKLIEKGQLEWHEDRLTPSSIKTQNIAKHTQETLDVLSKLRELNLPLTLANLQQFTDLKEWLNAIANWLIKEYDDNRIIDLDFVLDSNPDTFETILGYLEVDVMKIIDSDVIFSSEQVKQLQNKIHSLLRDKILNFSVPHKTLAAVIAAKQSHQPSSKTINELVEPVAKLNEKECQQVINSFESAYQKEVAKQQLSQMHTSHHPFEIKLQNRFPLFFKGDWEWDRLFQQLLNKIIEHAKSKGLYQSPEEWKRKLKYQSRQRFQQAQDSSKQNSTTAFSNKLTLATCHQLLGLNEQTSVGEIKIAFRKLAKAHHPDSGGDPHFFHSLNQAYTFLLAHYES